MKKLGIILGIFFGLILLALVVVPLVVDVDQFRPKIVQAASTKMNGTLELGKLSLSLWGKIHVTVDGLKILDLQKNQVVAVKDASFDSSYSSIFSGAPLITVHLEQPEISVIKDKEGKLNIMGLVKDSATPSGQPAAPDAGAKKTELPSMLVNAHTGISIKNAKLIYKDQAMALTNTIENLNVLVKDFSLTRKTEMEVWADLKTQMGTDLKVEGPLKLNADLTPEVVSGEFKSGTVNATFSADDLDIQKGTLFHKSKGMAAHFSFAGSMDQTSLKLKEAVVKFHNAEVIVSGVFDKLAGANIHFEAKPVDLKPWSELLPMLKEYELEGRLGLIGDVKGKPDALAYNAKMSIQNLSAKGPHLKAKPVINGTVDVLTDRIERFMIDLKGPGNDLALEGKVVSFSKPQVTFSLKSPGGMDLDQWIEFPPPEAKGAAKKDANGKTAEGQAVASEDLDAMVEPLRKNEIAKATSVDGTVSIAFLKAKGVRIDDIGTKVQLHNLVAALSGIHMKVYDGGVSGSFSTDLKPKEPQYNMNIALSGMDMQKAAAAQFQSMKDTIVGKLSFSAQGGGASFNTETAKKRLQMKGDFKFSNAQFKTIDIAKIANDAINGSIGKIADKVPFLKGKNFKVNENGDSRYDSITSHFTINGGVLDAPDFVAKATPKRGIDLRGSTKMGLMDQSLDAKWELIDTYHVTGADQFNVAVGGKQIHNFLAKGEKDAVIIPISVGCKWSAPCVNYSAAPEYLAGVAAGRLSNVAQDVVKEKVQEAGKKILGDQFKKLFGH
ncbi:MAG: AsmA family protein [Bdellovibrionales bacterium]|nr:AsmA family protein [Oligoflexia bacterium]